MEDKFRALEHVGAHKVLLYLLRKGSKNMTEICEGAHIHKPTFQNTIRALKEAGLVTETKLPKFPFSNVYTLTIEGERIAKLLVEIERVLEGK